MRTTGARSLYAAESSLVCTAISPTMATGLAKAAKPINTMGQEYQFPGCANLVPWSHILTQFSGSCKNATRNAIRPVTAAVDVIYEAEWKIPELRGTYRNCATRTASPCAPF
jgi:hypothetical protein